MYICCTFIGLDNKPYKMHGTCTYGIKVSCLAEHLVCMSLILS